MNGIWEDFVIDTANVSTQPRSESEHAVASAATMWIKENEAQLLRCNEDLFVTKGVSSGLVNRFVPCKRSCNGKE